MLDIQTKCSIIQICLFILSAAGFIIFLIPVFVGILNEGNTFGMVVFALLMPLTLIWHKIPFSSKPVKIISIVIGVLAVTGIIIVIIASCAMISAANKKPTGSEQTVIVLGCRVKGERPSLMLAKRINAAYEYLLSNPDAIAILSGGQGDDELISEAECMYRELTNKGISPDRLIKEDNSFNTYENILNSKTIMDSLGISGDVVIATNEFHQCRAQLYAKRLGLESSAASAPTAWYLFPTYWIRDCFGVILETIKA